MMKASAVHDHLASLKAERDQATIEDDEYRMRLDEIVEALEEQALYPDSAERNSMLSDQIRNMVLDYESEHPTIRVILNSLHDVLQNFRS